MPTPDVRPVGETAEQRALSALLDTIDSCSGALKPALDAYRDACKAEARAALLAGAPTLLLRHDGGHIHFTTLMPNGAVRHLGAVESYPSLYMPPGTVRRYALVPHPEGEPT